MLVPTLVALALQSTPARPAGRPDRVTELERLQRIEDELTRALFTARPWLAPVDDVADRSPELGAVTKLALDRWFQELPHFETAVTAVDEWHLPTARAQDLRWLATWLRMERILLSSTKPAERNPVFHVDGARSSLAAAARPAASGVLSPGRVRTLKQRLELVPAVWDAARRELESPCRPWCLHAADLANGLVRTIREQYEPLAELLPEDEREAFVHACNETARQTVELAQWLSERAAIGASDPLYVKTSQWQQLVRYATGWEADVDELHLRLLTAISDRRAWAGKHVHPAAVPAEELEPARIAAGIADCGTALVQRAREERLVPSEGPRFEALARRGRGSGLELCWWQRPSFDTWRLVVALPEPHWGPEPVRTRRDRLSPDGRRALAVRYGPLGESLLMWSGLSSQSTTRAQLPSDIRRRAFGLYAADWVQRTGVVDASDERLRALCQREILLEAARFLAALELHGALETRPTAVEHFVAHTGVDRKTAEWEVVQATLDPLHGIAILALFDTLELERSLASELDAEDPGEDPHAAVRATLRVLLSHTVARVRDLNP